MVKAVGMISGGLDSTLAVKLMLDQGIQVLGLNFNTGFCFSVGQAKENPGVSFVELSEGVKAGRKYNFPVEVIHLGDDYLKVVTHPKHGYGKNVNPCIDCRLLMLTRAREYMEKVGADFVFTGEVLGQRPMTQHRNTLNHLANASGLKGRLLRPLSAKRLAPTIPEEEGLVDRSRLLDIMGRGRKRQMALAREFELEDYPQPAGGCCYLTDPGYARRFKDLLAHRDPDTVEMRDFHLLKLGRHLRVAPDFKVIVGRDERENKLLEQFLDDHPHLEVLDFTGPLVLLEGNLTPGRVRLAAGIAGRYGKGRNEPLLKVMYSHPGGDELLEVAPLKPEEVETFVIH